MLYDSQKVADKLYMRKVPVKVYWLDLIVYLVKAGFCMKKKLLLRQERLMRVYIWLVAREKLYKEHLNVNHIQSTLQKAKLVSESYLNNTHNLVLEHLHSYTIDPTD